MGHATRYLINEYLSTRSPYPKCAQYIALIKSSINGDSTNSIVRRNDCRDTTHQPVHSENVVRVHVTATNGLRRRRRRHHEFECAAHMSRYVRITLCVLWSLCRMFARVYARRPHVARGASIHLHSNTRKTRTDDRRRQRAHTHKRNARNVCN